MRQSILLYLLSFLLSQSALAQNHPSEIIHIQFDKQMYHPGDTVWLKAYVVVGQQNYLSRLSRIAHIDLIGEGEKILQSLSLPLSFGIGVGNLVLPATVSANSYRIRAYTNWMRNFDQAYFFEKDLTKPDMSTPTSKNEPSEIHLYPEGGSWSYSRPNRVVYRINQAQSNQVFSEGWLETEQGERLSDIPAPSDGMGEFVLLPQTESKYRVAFRNTAGEVIRRDLPMANSKGYGLAVNSLLEKHITVQVWSKAGAESASLVVHSKGQINMEIKLDSEKSTQAINIPRGALPDGVTEISLVSESMETLAYRKIYNLPAERSLPLQATTNKSVYSRREKVTVNVKAGSEADTLRIGSFSVSVTPFEKEAVRPKMNHTILSSLLFEPSLKKHDLIQFFLSSNGNSENRHQLDLFLLSLPPSSFSTPDTVRFPAEEGILIKGSVTNEAGKPQAGSRVTLFSPDTQVFLDTVTNDQGRFEFGPILFYNGTNFIAQAHGSDPLRIELDNTARGGSTTNAGNNVQSESSRETPMEANPVEDSGSSIMLKEVEIKSREQRMRHAFNQKDPGEANRVIHAKDLQGCTTLEHCLQGRLAGVRFSNGKAYSTRTAMSISSGPIPMAVIVDGVHIFEAGSGPSGLGGSNALASLSPSDVETIEVIRGTGTVIYGPTGAGGVILITTKRGSKRNKDVETPGVEHFVPKGLTPPNGFYSPNRASLYWNPNLLSDQNGNASFEFYTGDEPGRYQIFIEGVDLQGRLGISILEFEVK